MGRLSMIATHQMLELWSVEKEVLFHQAVNNPSFIDSIIVQTLDENLKLEHRSVSGFSKSEKKYEMYVISTRGQ